MSTYPKRGSPLAFWNFYDRAIFQHAVVSRSTSNNEGVFLYAAFALLGYFVSLNKWLREHGAR
jgi:hypothetical protein